MGTHADPLTGVPRKLLSTGELILQEAERLITLKGVYGFTLKDIADPLDVQVPAIYKHYKSRDDVLIALARRFISELSQQFKYPTSALAKPTAALRQTIGRFVEFHISHPAYVRLSLADFATPQGGMEYVRLAAGGTFRDNLTSGPLAPMHERLEVLILAGRRLGEFRAVGALDLYRLLKSTLLLRLVYPDDLLSNPAQLDTQTRQVKALMWDVAVRYIAAGGRRSQ
jgi:AcrR family transcriptional regulator